MNADEFGKGNGAASTQRLQDVDQQLQSLKRLYNHLDADDREALKDWLERLNQVAADHPIEAEHFWFTLRLGLEYNFRDPQEGDWKAEHAELPPTVVWQAVSAWENGEEFAPNRVVADL